MAKRSAESLLALPEIKPSKRLPVLSKVSDSEISNMPLADAIAEAHVLRDAEKRLKEIKARITELLIAKDADAVRCGKLCVIKRWMNGRRTFDRELAIENGVTPAQIEASMKEGAGYHVLELDEIREED